MDGALGDLLGGSAGSGGGGGAHSSFLRMLSIICGWTYFFAWSLSFYPQVWTNFKRKSVAGLSFDFLTLNISGYICYSVFNCSLFWSPLIHRQYYEKHPDAKVIPVEPNDVFFALHGFALTAITIFQVLIYDRGGQRVSWITIGLSVFGWSSALVVVILGAVGKVTWLWVIYWFSYMKLVVTATKYTPQVYLNCKRKCTQGWSIGNVLLDLSGGLLSFFQMFIDSINNGDWSLYFGNPVKLLLSILTLVYDSIFVIQHYCLYRNHKPPPPQPAKQGTDADSESPTAVVVTGSVNAIDEDDRSGETKPLLSLPPSK